MSASYPNLYRQLLDAYGPQNWWPADDAFEMMIGAILVQHTAWTNASRAIANLRSASLLDPERLSRTRADTIESLIRPAGVFKVKAGRIVSFVRWYLSSGGLHTLQAMPTPELRRALLSVHGIGPETADNMLVYAFDRPVMVIDAYARRLYNRYGLDTELETYAQLQAAVQHSLPENASVLGEFHALIVEHGKRICRPHPRCNECALQTRCAQLLG